MQGRAAGKGERDLCGHRALLTARLNAAVVHYEDWAVPWCTPKCYLAVTEARGGSVLSLLARGAEIWAPPPRFSWRRAWVD